MKKLLIVSAIFAMSSGYAFATSSTALTGQFGFGNLSVVSQGGVHSKNLAVTLQVGKNNASGIQQGGLHSKNTALTVQFGAGNTSIVGQD